ncbi:MAG: DUF1186 domain-containing protein [Pseudomonadota bacterium]
MADGARMEAPSTTTMGVDEILSEFTYADRLPEEPLKAATKQRTRLTPIFIKEIDAYLDLKDDERLEVNPLFFIFHLFGEWRENSAYRPLARLLRCPTVDIETVLGDAVTITSHRVMAAVFDGDPEPLYDIILDPEADEDIRSRMCETLAMLVHKGSLEREAVAQFLRDAFMNLRPHARCFVWQGWQNAIVLLGLYELSSLVRKAYQRGLIDPGWTLPDEFEANLRRRADQDHTRTCQEYSLFGDTIEELST